MTCGLPSLPSWHYYILALNAPRARVGAGRATREEKAGRMGIDLNAVEEDEPAGAAVCGELWHACAGAGVALPRRGSAVVYLPQAHLAEGGRGDGVEVPAGAAARVPPHVACRVVDVDLRVSWPARRVRCGCRLVW